MAGTIARPRLGKSGDADRASLGFETYLEANQEAARRRSRDAANGMLSRVEKSPYGGYVVRSWPIEILVDPDMRRVVGSFGGKAY